MRPEQIAKLIEEKANTLFRCPDGWASMERHDLPGHQRNLNFIPVPPATKMTSEELIEAMRSSYITSVKRLVAQITGVDID